MAEKPAPQDPDGPSLELPSLGFGRKRRKQRDQPTAGQAPAPEPAAAPAVSRAPALEPRPVEPRRTGPAASSGASVHVDDAPETDQDGASPPRRARPRPSLPSLGAVPATLLTGLLVGVITVGLVWASFRLCELLRGTSSCGDPGFLLLVAVLVVASLLGGALLRAWGVPEGGSTSFLGMALVAVVLMLFLDDELFAWWMVLAVPGVAMVAYLLAHRVTTAMVEPGGPELHR